jgi:hypothetical protein
MANLRISVKRGTGAYIRFYYNGWHHFMFPDRYEISDVQETMGVQITELFSQISRIEEPTSKEVRKYIQLGTQGMLSSEYEGIKHILLSDKVEMLINSLWYEIEIDRGSYTVRQRKGNAYDIEFRAKILNADVERRLIEPPIEVIVPDPIIPFVATKTATGVTTTSIVATGGINIIGNVQEYGVRHRSSGAWTKQQEGTTLTGDNFQCNIDSLSPYIVYQYEAYIVVDGVTYYGGIKQVRTLGLEFVFALSWTETGPECDGDANVCGGSNISIGGSLQLRRADDSLVEERNIVIAAGTTRPVNITFINLVSGSYKINFANITMFCELAGGDMMAICKYEWGETGAYGNLASETNSFAAPKTLYGRTWGYV